MSNPPTPDPETTVEIREQIAIGLAEHFHVRPSHDVHEQHDQRIVFAEDIIDAERRLEDTAILVSTPAEDTLPVDEVVTPESALEPDYATKKAFVEQMISSVEDSLKAKGINVSAVKEVPVHIGGASGSPELNSMFADLKRIQREFPKIHGKHVRIKKRKSKRDKK